MSIIAIADLELVRVRFSRWREHGGEGATISSRCPLQRHAGVSQRFAFDGRRGYASPALPPVVFLLLDRRWSRRGRVRRAALGIQAR